MMSRYKKHVKDIYIYMFLFIVKMWILYSQIMIS